MDDRWLAATIERPDGTALTFGPAERDLGRVLIGTEFSTQIPGGFAEGSLKIARPDGLDSTDIPLFASVRIYGPGNQTAYEGRVAAKPRFGVDEISVELEGWSAHLDDDETFREIYVDPDLNAWGPASVQRKIDVAEGGQYSIHDPTVNPDRGTPRLIQEFTGAWAAGGLPDAVAQYDSPGVPIGKVFGRYGVIAWVNPADAQWQWDLRLGSDDSMASVDTSGDLQPGGSPGDVTVTATTDRYTAEVRLLYHVAAGDEGKLYSLGWVLAVYGGHGLDLHDSDSFAWQGVLGSDVIKDAVRRASPLLSVLDTDIEESAFVIPALSFRELPNTARNVVEAVTLLGGAQQVPNDWGVYEGRRFFWRSAGSYGRTWEIRKDEGAKPEDEGEDAAQRANGLMVSFQDTAGTTFTVGPPDSGADFESDDLADTDPQNPVNLAGIPRRWRARDGGTSFEDGATILGRLALSEANRDGRRGSYSIPGPIDGEPPWLLRAGDRVREQDEPAATEEPVISTTYTHDESYAVQASIGLPPNRLDVILAQLAAVGGK